MKKLYAAIKNNIVENILVFEDPSEELLSSFAHDTGADELMDVSENASCGVGKIWNGSTFIDPEVTPSTLFDESFNDSEWTGAIPNSLIKKK